MTKAVNSIIMKRPGGSPNSEKSPKVANGIKKSNNVIGHSGRAYFLKLSLISWSNFLTSNRIPCSSKLGGNESMM